MRYYDKQTPSAYIFLPFIGACLAFIPLYVISLFFVDDMPQVFKLGSLFLLYLFFLCWFIYSERHKDYLEMKRGSIQMIYDEGRKKPPIVVKTSEIDLFEIISGYHPLAQKYYRVYASGIDFPGPDKVLHFDSLQVPVADVLQFCEENGITPADKKMKLPNYDSVKLRKQDIIIKYDTKWWFRKIRIPIEDISSIELVHPHPISVTEDYYEVSTKGNCHQFWHNIIGRGKLERYCKKHNLPFSEKTLS